MDNAQTIWNRALGLGGELGSGDGDRALASVLRLHGLAMSGGLLNALEMLPSDEVSAATDGYRWLGLDEAADVVQLVRHEIEDGIPDDVDSAEALERRADDLYYSVVPLDSVLDAAFRTRLNEDPASFDPV